MAIRQGVYIGGVGAVFIEPNDDAVVAQPLFDFGFEDGGDGAESRHLIKEHCQEVGSSLTFQ